MINWYLRFIRKRPSFRYGVMRVFGLVAETPDLPHFDLDTGRFIDMPTDAEAIAGDWYMVGEDMRTAFGKACPHEQK